ncbi:MAG: helix-turn-helix domain-containing protein [Gammaproteobacteria bacterium]|nr:helix-turn-helix domain-containing protein [Gammaproteobacteria bacterium]
MSNRDIFAEIMEGLEAVRDRPKEVTRHEFSAPDVRAVRKSFGISQTQMAALLSVSVRTLQNWEQGHREPSGSAQVLLRILEREPEAVMRALHA